MEHIDAPPDDAMNAVRFDPLLTAIIEALRASIGHGDPAEHADEQMDLAA
jgi:hypothetical protein